jgi:Tfp pilus assembly protein PilF
MQFRNTTRSLREIAAALDVDAVVEGAVLRTTESVRITARLIDARSERQLWRGEYENRLSDAIGLQREIASTIGREIRGELTEADTARLSRRTDVDPEAFQAYLRGRFHWNLRSSSDLQQAATFFEKAIARDPDFALAHAGLADVYVLLGDFRDMLPAEAYRRARESVDAALRLDPSLAEAHTTRAWLSFAVDRDWKAAEAGFTRALQLNAGYATAQQWHGEFLAALGRFDDAFAALRRARQLDPLALMPQANATSTHCCRFRRARRSRSRHLGGSAPDAATTPARAARSNSCAPCPTRRHSISRSSTPSCANETRRSRGSGGPKPSATARCFTSRSIRRSPGFVATPASRRCSSPSI